MAYVLYNIGFWSSYQLIIFFYVHQITWLINYSLWKKSWVFLIKTDKNSFQISYLIVLKSQIKSLFFFIITVNHTLWECEFVISFRDSLKIIELLLLEEEAFRLVLLHCNGLDFYFRSDRWGPILDVGDLFIDWILDQEGVHQYWILSSFCFIWLFEELLGLLRKGPKVRFLLIQFKGYFQKL